VSARDAVMALARPWPGGLLALSKDDARVHLPAIAAAATFLTCLAIALALMADGIAQRWRSALAQALTVEIAPRPDMETQLARALQALRAMPAVASAEPLTREQIRRLITPWLGEDALIDGLPLPALVDLRVKPGAAFDVEAAQRTLTAAAPDARIDDHRGWRDSVVRIGWMATSLAGAMLLAVLVAAVSAVVFATRARLAVHREHIEILHLMGALDRTIANEFALDAARLATIGGLLGLALAFAMMGGLAALAGSVDAAALPLPRLGALDWAIVLLPLPAGALLAGATAALAAHGVLRRMP
jgi:cell division transport system permease protein